MHRFQCKITVVYLNFEQVYAVYSSKAFPDGMHLKYALRALHAKGVHMQPHVLLECVRELCDDGRLYSTIDDEHHKCTCDDF